MLSTIDLNWSLADLNHFVCQSFPMISLNLVGFELAKVDKGKKIKKVQANSVRDLKKVVGKSRLYVLPRAEVSQDRRRQEFSAFEERRLKRIEERQNRRTEEPADGIPLKFTFPDGTVEIRKFLTSEQIQVVFDFIGSHPLASEYFYIRAATSSVSIINTVSGTLVDHYFTFPMNIHVRWMDMQDVQDIFQQQNVFVWRTSDQSEGSDDLDVPSLEDMYSDHIQVVGDLQLLDPGSATYSNYIDIMPDNEIEIMPDNEIVELDEALDASEVVMVHGGPSPGFFSPTLFECVTNGNVSPTIEDVNDFDLTAKFTNISHAASMEEFYQATEGMSEYLANAGCLRAVKCLQDKDLLLQDILLFQVVNRLHGPLERRQLYLLTGQNPYVCNWM
ncbi:G2/M phase-specific E3 ubiquitin-protein ligase [Triplophysa tibetana]|uniref:G2/M phase-specific E3 ubiquitin-protein ligase n=1 Tax=Triplophysa tibetana TaxID=1572043 RepID=A0A5A9NZH6_9TELE|nr:G2/M phase-specific E3 ubiquitin-protein ligase [Triplophysa tibetana]